MHIVKINSAFIDKVLRKLKFLRNSDTGEANQIAPFGDDSTPPVNYKGIYSRTSTAETGIILGYFNRNQITEPGEKRIYSLNSNNQVATFIYLLKDGKIKIGGDSNYLVKYNELKEEYDKTKEVLDAILNIINGSPIAEPGNGSQSALQLSLQGAVTGLSTGDISSSKNENILTS